MTLTSPQLILAGVVFAGIAAFVIYGQEKANDTPIDEPLFRLILPGHWSKKPSSDPTRWVYYRDNREQLTVSVFGLKSGMGVDERSKMFKHLVEVRKNAESATSGMTAVTTTDTGFSESGGILAARYGGTEPAANRRFVCLILGSTSAFTVFYYEGVWPRSTGN